MTRELEPRIVTRDAVPTAVIRGRERMDELTTFYDRAFETLGAALGAQGIQPREAFGRYGAMQDGVADIEVGFVVDGPVEAGGGVLASELPAGEYATSTHVGPYEGLQGSWEALGDWIQQQGRTSGQTVFEVYVDNPSTTSADVVTTDLFWSLD